MPLYEYYCTPCDGVFELLRPASQAESEQPCPVCDATAARMFSSFEAYTQRSGYARKLPDDGTYWHFGRKVSRRMTGSSFGNPHPEIARTPERPPSREEVENHEHWAHQQRSREREREEAGLGRVIDGQAWLREQRWNQRTAATQGEGRLAKRRQPNTQKSSTRKEASNG